MRFWLDRGVDGFRIDVAHGMSKPEGLPDAPDQPATLQEGVQDDPRFDHEDVHDVHRMIRAVIDHYPGRIAVGEVRVADDARFARYVRSDELHLGFNSRLLRAPFDAAAIREAIENTLDAVAEVNAPPAWILSNHDTSRPVTRYGGGAVGRARARAMMLVELALPGAVHLYNGEELGLPDVDAARRRAAGPGVGELGAHRTRPRRQPGADPVGGRPARVRVHHRRPVAADAAGVRRAHRGRAAGGHRLDAVADPAGAGAAQDPPRLQPGAPWSGSAPRTAAWPSAGPAPPWSAR